MLEYKPDWTRVSTSTGYQVVFCPDHPAAWTTGYVYVHRLVAEQKLGRLLNPGEVVHHLDGNRRNNSPENLEIISRSKHASKHAKATTYITFTCPQCGKPFSRRKGQEPEAKGFRQAFCSRLCNGKYQRNKDWAPYPKG